MLKKVLLGLVVLTLLSAFFVSAEATEEWALNYSYSYSGFFGGPEGENATEQSAENKLPPIDDAVTYEGNPSMRINILKSAQWWCGYINISGLDLTEYEAKGSLQFAIKGEKGGEELGIGFADNASPQVNASMRVKAEQDWKVVNIPIKEIRDAHPFLAMNNLNSFLLVSANSNVMKVWIADVRVLPTTPEPPPTTTTTTEATTAAPTTANTTAAPGATTKAGTTTQPTDTEAAGLGVWVYVLIVVIVVIIAGGVFIIMKNKKKA